MLKQQSAFLLTSWICLCTNATTFQLAERLEVGPAWAGCPVGFALATHTNRQFIAYYDDNREMTLAQRDLSSSTWQFKRLPSKLGWDSHNYIAITIDLEGYLHVSGNMHAVPLVYFRSTKPLEISSVVPLHRMTGDLEKRVTYPRFMSLHDSTLIFTYRDGGSGNGNQIWNRYDIKTKTWQRLIDSPLFDGQGKMNAYMHGPERGPDGVYHLAWVWRDTPACETCHTLSYARSRDLVSWENINGKPVRLPIRLGADVVVADLPIKSGLINCAFSIGFDIKSKPVLTYTKHDEKGNTQLMNTRHDGSSWNSAQASNWDYRWAPTGGGTIVGEIGVGAVEMQDGKLAQNYSHAKLGNGRWFLDESTLKPTGKAPGRDKLPSGVIKVERSEPNMRLNSTSETLRKSNSNLSRDGFLYRLVWECLPANRDRPQPDGAPAPSTLRLFKFKPVQ